MGKEKKDKKAKNKSYTEKKVEYEEKPNTEYQTTAEVDEEDNKKEKEGEIDFKIETIGEHPDKISPIIGYFPSGFDPLKNRTVQNRLQDEQSSTPQPRVRVYRNVKRSNRLQVVVSPNESQVDFVGTNYMGEATAPQICTYALGVLDKATQTLKIVPIAANKIFRLEPKVGESGVADNEPSELLKEELTVERKAEKFKDLTLMYSTKKTIRQAKKMESLKRIEDPKSQAELEKTLESIQINKEALEVAETTTSARNVPPHNLTATTPQKAYPLDKIILSGEWDFLLDIVHLSQVGEELAADVYPSFVCNRAYKLETIEDEVEKQTLACIFSYITHLIKFKDKHSLDGFSSAKYHKTPNILSQKFSSMFADADSRRLSDAKRDLLISYVLVLTLFADDFRTDPLDIAKDLRMNAIALRPHYEHLGCKLVREGQLLLATLPVPLQFPTTRRKRRRR